ncbi:MAG: aminotransferase class I/II-fold pyridoxal phosphate-dependent enzyme [Bacteroidetes bacterium]|nr:aminotransferase class I/II-fold pyridoxal phosphate-dependent enzyme [Bacteroidota bacterium]
MAGDWLSAKGYSVGLLEPAFDNLHLLLKRRQVKIFDIQEEDLLDLNVLSKKIDKYNLKSIFIISPNNPTGFELNIEEFRALSELCKNKNVAIIIDKTFRLYSRNNYDDYQILTNNGNDYLVIEDTGKTWATHETKVSLMAYSESLAQELKCLYEEVYLCHSKFSVNLLSHLIEKTHQVGIDKIIWEEIDKRKAKLFEAIKDTALSLITNERACSIPMGWIDCSASGLTDIQLVDELKKYGVMILPGRFFYWNSQNKHTENVRISLLRSDAIFDKGLESLRIGIQKIKNNL